MSNTQIIKALKKFKVEYLFNNGTLPPPHVVEAYLTSLED